MINLDFIKNLYEKTYKNLIKWNVIEEYNASTNPYINSVLAYTFKTIIFSNTIDYEIIINSCNRYVIEIKENNNVHLFICHENDEVEAINKLYQLLVQKTIESEKTLLNNIIKGI